MYIDNKDAIDLMTSEMQTKQIPTADMVADGCTKPLGSEAHFY